MGIKSKLRSIIKNSIDVDLEISKIRILSLKDKQDGDYITDIAFLLENKLNKNPFLIAKEIKNKINDKTIEKIEITKNGYLNFYISKEYLLDNVINIINSGKDYGKINYKNNLKVNIGYTNFNNFNIDYARSLVYIDCMANILSFIGCNVTKDYYLKKDETSIDKIKDNLDSFRVNLDNFISEENLSDEEIIDNTLNNLKRSNKCYIKDNSLWLKTSLKEDILLVKEDGEYTYMLSDIAYYISRLNKDYDEFIDVFNLDNYNYVNNIKSVLELLGNNYSRSNVRYLPKVRIIKNNEEVNITLDKLLEEVKVNNFRYFLISKPIDEQVYFDFDLIVKNTNENPLYYIENANIILSSIIRGKNIDNTEKIGTIDNDNAYIIMNKLLEFEDIIISSARKTSPHIICDYLYSLANSFYSYYYTKKDKLYTNDELMLIKSIKIVINNIERILGLILREEM